MATDSKNFVSPRDLAKAVGVSESSLKRWVDDGRISVARTAGGHRRIPVAEAIRFVRESDLKFVRPEIVGLDGLIADGFASSAASASVLADLMKNRDGDELSRRLISAFIDGCSVAELVDHRIRPALEEVGVLYHTDPMGISIEHAAVDQVITALGSIRRLLPRHGDSATVATGGAIAGDPYAIPSLGAATVLHEIGFRAINTGPNMPLDALIAMAREVKASLIWRSSSLQPSDTNARQELEALQEWQAETGGNFVLGGRGFAKHTGGKDAGPIFGSLTELSGFARALRQGKVASSRAS